MLHLFFLITVSAEALVLFTRDWDMIPKLGGGWNPQTGEVFEKPKALRTVISRGTGFSTQSGCIESSDADEILAWLQGSNLSFSPQDIEHVDRLLSRARMMVFCYSVKTFDPAHVETMELESADDFLTLPPEIIIADRRQNLTVLAWEKSPETDAVWVNSTLPADILDAGLRGLGHDFQTPAVLALLTAFSFNPEGERTCWVQSVPGSVLFDQKKWVNLPSRRGTMPLSI